MLKKINFKHLFWENRFLLLFLVFNVIAHWKLLVLDTQLAYGDFFPFPQTAGQSFKNFFYTWYDVGFGLYRQAGNFTYLFLGLFTFILRSPLLAQKVFILLLPLISYLSLENLLKKHVNIRSGLARFIPNIFYAFSPVALGEFTGGSQFSTMLTFSILPAFFSLTLTILKRPSLKLIFLQGLLLGFLFGTNNQTILLYFLCLLLLFFYDLVHTRFKALKRWLILSLTGIIAALINPIALLSSFNILYNTTSGGEARSFVDSASQFLMEIHITYADNTLGAISRMGSVGAFDYKLEHYWSYPFYAVILFVLFTVIRKLVVTKKPERLILVSLLNYLLITFFVFFTVLEWTFPIFRTFPLLFMFRNPSKLIYMSTFFFSVIFAYSLDLLFISKLRLALKYLVVLVILVIQFVYTWPIFTFDRGLAFSRVGYLIPKEYYQAVETLKSLRKVKDNRSTWLPIAHEYTFIKLLWLDRNKLDAQIGMGEFGGAAFEKNVLESVYYAIFRTDQNAALNTLRIAQVDYLVVFKDNYFFEQGNMRPELIEKTFAGVPKVESTDYYDIYDIGTKFSLFYTPNNIYATNIPDSYHALSKIKNEETFAVLQLDALRQQNIEPDIVYIFITDEKSPPLSTNIQWREDWYWKAPANYPKLPGQITPDTDTYSYLMESVRSMAEITEYLTSRQSVSQNEASELLNSYTNTLRIFNLFMTQAAQDQNAADMSNMMIMMYLYADKSYLRLRDSKLVTQEITDQYNNFIQNVKRVQGETCQFDFCYTLRTFADSAFDLEVFDVDGTNMSKSIVIDGREHKFEGYTDPNWMGAGKVFLESGEHNVGLDLDQIQRRYEFDDEGNILYVYNDEAIRYDFTFLYSFSEDVYMDLYNIPEYEYRPTDKYLVWKGYLASTTGSEHCYIKENDRCYRIFVGNLAPNNNYEKVRATFYQDVSTEANAPNHIKNISFKELLDPVLLLWNRQSVPPRQKPEVSFKQINPVKYVVEANNIQADFILVFNQSFNNNWNLKTSEGKIIPPEQHFKANYYANAWLIKKSDSDGRDKITLELSFPPQNSLNISLMVTLVSVSVSLFFIFKKKSQSR